MEKSMYENMDKDGSSDSENEHSSLNTESVWSTQINLACETLVWSGNFERLERFLWALPEDSDVHEKEVICVARICVAFKNQEHQRLYEFIQERQFSKKYHSMLQVMWRISHYREAEKQRGRVLCAVGKYRIRRKHPLPKTIWDGKSLSHCFSEESRNALNRAYKQTPYPTASEKMKLAESANLSVVQVQNWFKNKRQRTREMENKQKRVICKSSDYFHHREQGNQMNPESLPPSLIPKRFLFDNSDQTQHSPTNTSKKFALDYSARFQPKPIKPTFHRVKPIVLPIMQQYPAHTFVTPAILYQNNVREKHFIRCVDVTTRKYVINKPPFEYER